MKKSVKFWLITAAALIVAGGILFTGVMTAMNWDFTKLSTVKYETNSHTIDEEFKNISIKTLTAGVTFLPSNDGKVSVVCAEETKLKHLVSVKEDTLVIEYVDSRKWYEHIGINFGSSKITVYLPEGEYGAASINSTTGGVTFNAAHSFEKLDISLTTGDVELYSSARGNVNISATTGNLIANDVSAGDIEHSVSTGKVCFSNVTCKSFTSKGTTGSLTLKNLVASGKLSAQRGTGNITLDKVDAAELHLKATTGSVNGSLLSDKIFVAKSTTGTVTVPNSASGGKCEISTSTGSINIEIAE